VNSDTAGERVVVRRVIPATRERVFRSWTEPELLQRWWGPGGFTCPAAQVDLRPGGTYRLVMLGPPGVPEMSVTGTYRRVDPPELLVYTWRWDSGPAASPDESLVTVEFNRVDDDHTEVIVTHQRFPTGHDASPYRSGWEEGLEKLEAAITAGGEVNV
jgi:uncharacterized protein YndB with AHSA1/START domain